METHLIFMELNQLEAVVELLDLLLGEVGDLEGEKQEVLMVAEH